MEQKQLKLEEEREALLSSFDSGDVAFFAGVLQEADSYVTNNSASFNIITREDGSSG